MIEVSCTILMGTWLELMRCFRWIQLCLVLLWIGFVRSYLYGRYLICGFIIVSLTCTLTVFRDRDIDDVLVALAWVKGKRASPNHKYSLVYCTGIKNISRISYHTSINSLCEHREKLNGLTYLLFMSTN